MRVSVHAVIVVLLTTAIALSKDKKNPRPALSSPVYDHTGTVRYLPPHWDSSTFVTFSDGSTASMFCNYDGTTTVCSARYSDSGGWFADLGDGMSDALALVHTREWHERCTSWADSAGRGSASYCADPLNQLRTPGLTFPYRLTTAFTGGVGVCAFCVPYTWGLCGGGHTWRWAHPPRSQSPRSRRKVKERRATTVTGRAQPHRDAAGALEVPSAAQASTSVPVAAKPAAAAAKDESVAPSGSVRITSTPESASSMWMVRLSETAQRCCTCRSENRLRFTLSGYKEKTSQITVLPNSESKVVAVLDKL